MVRDKSHIIITENPANIHFYDFVCSILGWPVPN